MSGSTSGGAISNRLARIQRGEDPQMLARMGSGYAILGKFQPDAIVGACMLIPDPVVPSLNDLDDGARGAFLCDFARLGDAVLAATGAQRINYLILCNQVPELHAHAIPRFAGEDPDKRLMDPFTAYDFGAARIADALGPDKELADRLRSALSAVT